METTRDWWNPARAIERLTLSPTLARRGLATALDLALVSLLQIGLGRVFGVIHASIDSSFGSLVGGDGLSISSGVAPTLLSGTLLIIVVAYFTLFETLFTTTPGKALLRLRIVSLDGRPLTFRAILGRNIFRLVDALPFLYIVGGIVAQSTLHEQRVGDIVAGTTVVSLGERGDGAPPIQRLPLRLLLLGALLVGLIGGALVFQYFGRGPLVIQSWVNMIVPYDSSSSVRCGPFAPLPVPVSAQVSAGAFQAPGQIMQYAIGAPQWGNGVVTYPIRVQLNDPRSGGYISGEPALLDMSQIYVSPGGGAYNGSITLRWEGPLTGWVMQSGRLDC